MPEGHRHRPHAERCQIHALRKSGLSGPAIARQLGRDRTTVWREVRRNSGRRGYRHKQAQRKADRRRSAASSVARKMTPELWRMAEERLAEGWSPEQVSGRLRKEGEPMAGRQWIYERIHADRKAGGGLWRHLRRRGKKPNWKGGAHTGRGRIPGRVDISERPDVVEAKERVGDREADTNQRQGHRRRACLPGGQGVQAHAARKGREEDGGRGRLGHDRHAGPSPRAHGHRGQRQGVRGPCQSGRGAGRGVLLRAALPLLGARPERAHQRPRAGIPAQGHGLPQGDGRGREGPAERTSEEGPGLPHPVRGLPTRAQPP